MRQGLSTVDIPSGAIVTPLARDTARDNGVKLRTVAPGAQAAVTATAPHVVAIGSDHGGYDFKRILSKLVRDAGWQVLDVGTDSVESCDYPDFAYAVGRAVAARHAAWGIMIDGAGIGSAIACNKIDGIRAACAYSEFTAWNARAHNDANVLTLGSRSLGIEVCKRIVHVFLSTSFEGGRHQRRVDKMSDIEARSD